MAVSAALLPKACENISFGFDEVLKAQKKEPVALFLRCMDAFDRQDIPSGDFDAHTRAQAELHNCLHNNDIYIPEGETEFDPEEYYRPHLGGQG